MAFYDKDEIKNKLTTEQVEDIVRDFGGDPRQAPTGFVAGTICHNHPGEGSHKLYYYENTRLFRCYTGCDATFDIFELLCKINKLAGREWSLPTAVRYVAQRYGWSPKNDIPEEGMESLADADVFSKYDHRSRSEDTGSNRQGDFQFQCYDSAILDRLAYPIIRSWVNEGISPEVLKFNRIGYYPGGEQITIPHFSRNGNFIGLRGRALSTESAELYGKYRPCYIGGIMYNHPLGWNLYNLNNSEKNIKKIGKAIIFEGEKSCLLYQSYFGHDADISVACCGSAVSSRQMELLIDAGAKEVIIAFDKQFQTKGDAEFKHLINNLKAIHRKYNNYVSISFIFDKENLLGYKDSPIDRGAETFMKLFKDRIVL